MALELGGFTPVGYAADIDLSLPPNGTLLITSGGASAVASFRSAAATGGVRIKIASGISLALTSRLNIGARTQILCLSGTGQIDTTAIGGDSALGVNNGDIFWGNIEFLCNVGTVSDGGNDPAGLFAFDTANADRLYIYQCRRVIPSSAGGDAPEGFNSWNNGPSASDGPNDFTFHGWLASPNSHGSKNIITGGSASAANTRGTMYRSVSYAWQRSFFIQDGAKADIVNSVIPTNVDRIEGFTNSSSEMNVRGCALGKTSDSTPGRLEVSGGSATYAPTSGAGTDNNLLVNGTNGTPTLSASKATPYSLPYTLTPESMDSTLMNAIIAAAGPGIYTITEGGSAPSFTSPATRRNIQRALA